MPIAQYSNKIVFKNNKEPGEIKTNVDFGLNMLNAIDVQLIDTNIYLSKELWLPYGSRGAFGGQIVAQALHAAWDTVASEFFVHSLHAYFILACSVDIPVVYEVSRIRDGKSFATRTVTAKQKGRAIFLCTCSFVKPDNNIHLDHQTDMPEALDPDTLPSDVEFLQNALLRNTESLSSKFIKKAEKRIKDEQPVDYRDAMRYTHEEYATGNAQPNPHNQRWFKTRGVLNDDKKFHACIIAYASDSGLINTAARANGYSFNSEGIGMMTSLDHSIWFHRHARADEWLLYDTYSPRTTEGRGVAFGRIYTRDGFLVATTAQEGIVRLSESEQEKLRKELEQNGVLSVSVSSHNLNNSKL